MSGYQGKFGTESARKFLQHPDWYEQMFFKHGDPRVSDSLWLRTPELTVAVVVLYLVFVFVGPSIMERRKPFDLKRLIVAYNFLLVALSAYMSIEFFLTSTLLGYSYFCQGIDWQYSTDPLNAKMVNLHWLFFVSKIVELADTIFFILRKKDGQVTFLHVYHHATMILNWWMVAKYVPVGQSFFVGMVNSSIHSLMYLYYALAALGPHMQKYLWWKKYMTTLQLVQFIMIISHTAYNKFARDDCDYPFLFNSIAFYYTISMVVLFSDFYYRTYVRRRPAGKSKHDTTNGHKHSINNNPSEGAHGSGHCHDDNDVVVNDVKEFTRRSELRNRKQ